MAPAGGHINAPLLPVNYILSPGQLFPGHAATRLRESRKRAPPPPHPTLVWNFRSLLVDILGARLEVVWVTHLAGYYQPWKVAQ